MEKPYHVWVQHVPFAKPYRGRRPEDAESYDKAVVRETKSWPKVVNACLLKVTFVLPASKFADTKFLGPDLDNLMKRLMDNLKQTIFAPPADDSFVVTMEVSKTRVETPAEAGVHIEVVPLHTLLIEHCAATPASEN